MRFAALALLVSITGVPSASAAVTGFDFAGEVSYSTRTPFDGGLSLVPTTPVVGRILYAPASPSSDSVECDSGECVGYRQHIINGMSADFDGLVVTADDYVVQVKNDIVQSGVTFDRISFVYRFDVSPLLPSQLKANGAAQPKAWFQIDLNGPADALNGSALPPSIDVSRFESEFNFLDEDATKIQLPNGEWSNSIDVLFGITSLAALAVPGDYNGDRSVTPADYDDWRATFDSTSSLDADGNGNHAVDAADYVVWRNNYAADAQSASVPEPSTLASISLGVLTLASGARRLRRREI